MTEVRVIGWGPEVSEILHFVFMVGIAFGMVLVILVTAASLAILTRRGS